MPPDVRAAYKRLLDKLGDKDKDGIPDVVQQGTHGHGFGSGVLGITKTTITVNGKTYGSRDEMPADVRALYDKAIAQAGTARSGVSASPGPGGKSPAVRLDYTYGRGSGGTSQETPAGSRTLPVLLIGVALGALVMWWLLK